MAKTAESYARIQASANELEIVMIYCYWVSLGLASLHKMHIDGNDTDAAPKKIGKFKTDEEAKRACLAHYEKACKMAKAAGRPEPKILFM